MSRRASSSSSSSSSSSGGVQGKKGSGGIEAVCQTTQASLRELAEMTKKCEGMPPAVVNRWKEKIIALSEDSAKLSAAFKITKNVIESETKKMKEQEREKAEGSAGSSSASSSSAQQENVASIVQHINSLITASTSNFDVKSAANVKDIHKVLGTQVDDDEIQINEEVSEATFKCPVMCQKIEDPVTNGICRHIVSRKGMMGMFGAVQQVKCFTPGCNAVWTKQNIVHDEAFQDRMDRFFRRKERASNFATEHNLNDDDDALNVDEDD